MTHTEQEIRNATIILQAIHKHKVTSITLDIGNQSISFGVNSLPCANSVIHAIETDLRKMLGEI